MTEEEMEAKADRDRAEMAEMKKAVKMVRRRGGEKEALHCSRTGVGFFSFRADDPLCGAEEWGSLCERCAFFL